MHRLQLHYTLGRDTGPALVRNPLIDLLQAVDSHGSISAAARALGLSYRHVWGALKRWEDTLGEPLVTWTKGQPARLTPFSERLLWAETRARTRLTPHIEALRAELERVLAEALDGNQQVLTIFASHDLALPRLRDLAAQQGLHIDLRFAGSLDALRALDAGRCLVAGFHVPPLRARAGRSASTFAQALKPLLQPGQHKLIGCVRRTQGLMVHPLNPHRLRGLPDLAGSPARFINRQRGSGTRLLMDHLLAEHGIDAATIRGYADPPEDSHVAVAAAVASGQADVGAGIEAAALQFGLDFIPLITEDYFLACLKHALEHPAEVRLREVLGASTWLQAVAGLPGYEPAHSGGVLALTRALPWWNYRVPRPHAHDESADGGDANDDDDVAKPQESTRPMA